MLTRFDHKRGTRIGLWRALQFWPVVLALILFGLGCRKNHRELEKSDREKVLIAAMTDNVQLLEQMDAKGADLDAQYPERFNWTPLITAIYFQNTNVIAYLLNRGVDVRKRDASGETALLMAITGDDTNTAKLLFQKSPQAIREGEDWPTVRALIRAPPRDQARRNRWNTLIDEFLRTNTSASAKP